MNESTQILGIYHIPVPTEQIEFNNYMYILENPVLYTLYILYIVETITLEKMEKVISD